MKVLVISLVSEMDRREFMAKQLSALGLNFQFVPAFSVSSITNDYHGRAGYRWQRPLRKVEVACAMSHRAAWEEVVSEGEPHLILEDDALLSRKIPEILGGLEASKDLEFCSLETRGKRKILEKQGVSICDGYELRRLYLDRCGAAAYYLIPVGAQKLLAYVDRKGFALADATLAHCYELKRGQVFPAAALQLDMAGNHDIHSALKTTTTISSGAIAKPSPRSSLEYVKLRRNRLIGQLGVFCKHLQYRAFSSYIEPPILRGDFVD